MPRATKKARTTRKIAPDPVSPVARPRKAAKRAEASGVASDLETVARAALVAGSGTSEKCTAERLDDARDKVAADRNEAKREKDEGELSQAEK